MHFHDAPVTGGETSHRGDLHIPARGRMLVCDLAIVLAMVLVGIGARWRFLPRVGNEDMSGYFTWALEMHQGRLSSPYMPNVESVPQNLRLYATTDLPPGHLYVLRLVTAVYQWIRGRDFATAPYTDTQAYCVISKSPAVLADLATGVVLYLVLRRRVGRPWAAVVGTVYLLQPGVTYNSSAYPQVDAIHSLLMVLSLEFASRRRYVLMSGFAALALLFKVQSVMLAPLWALCLVLGADRAADGKELRPSLRERLQTVCTRRRLGRIAAGTGLAAALAVVFCTPFVMQGAGRGIVRAYSTAIGRYQIATLNAFNLWGLLYPITDPQEEHLLKDTTQLGGFSLHTIGMILLAASALVVVVKVVRRPEALEALGWGGLTLCLAFFAFPTQIHERYLHPAVAVGAWSSVRRWWWWPLWLIIGGVYALNIMWAFPLPPGDPGRTFVERLAPQAPSRIEIRDIDNPVMREALKQAGQVLSDGRLSLLQSPTEAPKPAWWWHASRRWGLVITIVTVTMLAIPPRLWRTAESSVLPPIPPPAEAAAGASP